MHPSHVTRRRFLSLTGAASLALPGGLFPRLASACPAIDLPPTDDAAKLANAVNAFAADLHPRLGNTNGTLFYSPLSISTALAMTSAGSKGTTLEQMQKVLHLPADPHAAFGGLLGDLNGSSFFRKRGYELTTANAIWAMKGFPWRKEFLELTRKHYGAGVIEIDVGQSEAARKQINDWVEKETHDKIKDLIPPGAINALTRMVLTNASYFKGKWQFEFDPKQTKDAAFTHVDGVKADVPLMHRTGEFGYGEFEMFVRRVGEKVQVLELPYCGGELSMLVYLPDEASGAGRLAQWLQGSDLGKPELRTQTVEVSLPRFKAETGYSLKPVLMDMGMKAAFADADFTGMSPNGRDLHISSVVHKAFVEVNEEGTEAAAATGVIIKERVSAPREPATFRADRPFVFTIRDNKTGAVLFLGRYSGPKA